MNSPIFIFPDAEQTAVAAATAWIDLAKKTIAERGSFHVALSGGSTPKRLYQLIASAKDGDTLNWQRIHIYFGDERCVPPDHPDSNFGMASEALLSHVNCPSANVHRVAGELGPERAAESYATELHTYLPQDENNQSRFDLVLLGIGDDGHTASLFPGTAALDEQTRDTCAVYVEKFDSWRVTLTYPLLNRATHVWVIATGASKADVIAEVLSHTPSPPRFPIQAIKPVGELCWYLDKASAAKRA